MFYVDQATKKFQKRSDLITAVKSGQLVM